MNRVLIIIALAAAGNSGLCQSGYPDPEFVREVYQYRKDSSTKLLRLEKGSSKMNTRTKAGGLGGAESSYDLDGVKSPVRLASGKNLSFIYSNGNSSPANASPSRDSMMRAQGMDPGMLKQMNERFDPSNTITLYKAESSKGLRKIILQKTPGAFGLKKVQSSDKLSFSTRKIKDGYWELVVDKTLPKGEYVFSVMDMAMGSMDGGTTLFAFGVD